MNRRTILKAGGAPAVVPDIDAAVHVVSRVAEKAASLFDMSTLLTHSQFLSWSPCGSVSVHGAVGLNENDINREMITGALRMRMEVKPGAFVLTDGLYEQVRSWILTRDALRSLVFLRESGGSYSFVQANIARTQRLRKYVSPHRLQTLRIGSEFWRQFSSWQKGVFSGFASGTVYDDEQLSSVFSELIRLHGLDDDSFDDYVRTQRQEQINSMLETIFDGGIIGVTCRGDGLAVTGYMCDEPQGGLSIFEQIVDDSYSISGLLTLKCGFNGPTKIGVDGRIVSITILHPDTGEIISIFDKKHMLAS